jgi:hypothetical protein
MRMTRSTTWLGGMMVSTLSVLAGCSSTPEPTDAGTSDGFLVFDIPSFTDTGAGDAGAGTDVVTPRDVATPRDTGNVDGSTTPIEDVRFVFDVQAVPEGGFPVEDVPAGEDGGAGSCTPMVTPEITTHVADMTANGWGVRNRTQGIMMHGCVGATRAQDCLASATRASATTFGANWDPEALPAAHLRVLFTSDYRTSFWSRSSADGRFVGHGARIVDLANNRSIPTAASYDPGFFPDNSGFFYHGSLGPRACHQSVLTTGTPTMITLQEAQCARTAGVGLYQHHGASLAGDDHYVIYGRYTSDDGGHSPTLRDPAADFGAGERQNVTVMANNGAGFTVSGTGSITTPNEADAIISPSGRLMLTRLGGPRGQTGFVLRRLTVTRTGSAVALTAPIIGRYCGTGAKGHISFDERWFVYHHYITDADATELGFTGPDDPAFAAYRTRGGANSYLVDLRTGARTRITNMQPGQYALFPHFRSDGWIYLIARTAGATPEHVVASDAALHIP